MMTTRYECAYTSPRLHSFAHSTFGRQLLEEPQAHLVRLVKQLAQVREEPIMARIKVTQETIKELYVRLQIIGEEWSVLWCALETLEARLRRLCEPPREARAGLFTPPPIATSRKRWTRITVMESWQVLEREDLAAWTLLKMHRPKPEHATR